jgi:hypothetical protein
MCGIQDNDRRESEIRPGEIKCRAYKRGYIVRQDDIEHFLRLGKDS